MSRGEPLTDEDRWPWLGEIGSRLAEAESTLIVGCPSLKRSYRDRIRARKGALVVFVHLSGTKDLIATRMAARTGHFMPTDLIESQFATLEPPGVEEDAITVDVAKPLEAIVDQIVVFFDAR
ncbi:gluconokinase [Neorhizobium sp. R1-B]|nr:gluconokinase [Neorhizobium sp. R1-B]